MTTNPTTTPTVIVADGKGLGKIKRLNRLIRCFFWRLCPLCNSDAPAKDNCPVCKSYSSGFYGMANDLRLADWWFKYIKHINNLSNNDGVTS